jgi:hypothetical protein
MRYVSTQPLPPAYYATLMMFSPRDREALIRLETKVDVALTRVAAVEAEQIAHKGICDVREKRIEEYMARKERDEEHSRDEWEKFADDSRADRAKIRKELWDSNNQLLWKLIVAMGVLLAAVSSAAWALMQHHP